MDLLLRFAVLSQAASQMKIGAIFLQCPHQEVKNLTKRYSCYLTARVKSLSVRTTTPFVSLYAEANTKNETKTKYPIIKFKLYLSNIDQLIILMSRQYLKQLKDRAEKLLELSSDYQDDEDEDINAYTATQGRTKTPRRIVLDQILPEEQAEEVSQFYQHQTTDIELLKRCINLTNQNNNLKFIVEKQSNQIQTLKNQIKNKSQVEVQLRKQIENKSVFGDKKIEQLSKLEHAMELVNQQKRQIQHQKLTLKKKSEQLERQRVKLKQQMQQFIKIQRESQRQTKKQIQIHNDYTIKNLKKQDVDKLKYKNEQLEQRLRRFQQMIREERNKSNRLCRFISKEIPALNNIIIELTAKLDAKFQKYILRNIEA